MQHDHAGQGAARGKPPTHSRTQRPRILKRASMAMDAVQLPGAGAGVAAQPCEYDALTLATSLERLAVHPIARAVVAKGVRDKVPRVPVEQFEVRGAVCCCPI